MEQRVLGRTGLRVSVLGFGGAEIGFEGATVSDVSRLLAEAVDAGLNLVDTASAYLTSEELIGAALEGRRSRVVLCSKCGATDGFTRSDWSKEGILAQLEQSLRRLRTDHLDLLQLHSCGPEVLERGEAIAALQDARARGLVRYVGYSGDGDAALAAIATGAFDTLQTSINVADQRVLADVLPAARAAGMGVIAKRPVANVAWRHGDAGPGNSYHQPYWERFRRLQYRFQSLPLTEAVAHALRFTLTQPGVTAAIVGTKRPGRWKENAVAVAAGPLPEAEVAEIRRRWAEVAGPDWDGEV